MFTAISVFFLALCFFIFTAWACKDVGDLRRDGQLLLFALMLFSTIALITSVVGMVDSGKSLCAEKVER